MRIFLKIFTDFPTNQIIKPFPVDSDTNFCDYQSHPYLVWKSFSVVGLLWFNFYAVLLLLHISYSGFETKRRHHQKSKTGVSVTPQKGLMSSEFLKKKKKKTFLFQPASRG